MLRRTLPALIAAALFAGLFLSSTANADDGAQKLLGRWLFANQQLAVEYVFGADGRFHRHVVTAADDVKADGAYKLKDGKLSIDPDDEPAAALNCKFIDDDTLELTDEDDNGLRFSRAPTGPLLKLAAPKKNDAGRILFTHYETVKVTQAGLNETLVLPRIWVMGGDGKNAAPLIVPGGYYGARQPRWTPDGKGLLFTSDFQAQRSALFEDIFYADLATGLTRRLTGNEWSVGPIAGVGGVHGTIKVPGGAVHSPLSQINIAVQGCQGRIFHPKGARKDEAGNEVPGEYEFEILGVPAGDVWVKAWVSRHIGDLAINVKVQNGKLGSAGEMDLNEGNRMVAQGSVTPDGRWLVCLGQHAWYDWQAKARGEVENKGFDTLTVADLHNPAAPPVIWEPTKMGGKLSKDPRLSPDGKTIVFALGTLPSESIAVCSLDSMRRGAPVVKVLAAGQTILGQGAVGHGQPIFSHDGKRIAFTRTTSDLSMNFTANLCVINADGSGLTQVTQLARNQAAGNPSFSPDGARLVFQLITSKRQVLNATDLMTLNYTSDLYVVNLKDGKLTRLTNDGASAEPDWGK